MKYRVGMYGGSFNPLHLGHLDCIIQAANMCERLYIVLSEGKKRNEIPVRVRYRWLFSVTSHLPDVKIITISDNDERKDDYSEEEADRDAAIVKQKIGEKIDIVFCGSDYDETSFWNRCYPESAFYAFQRNGINSTEIRRFPYTHREWMPQIVRPYYVKKVLVTGIESTGKSTLVRNLALRFDTNYLEETGRDISMRSGTDQWMLREDFEEILLRHKLREMELVEQSNGVLFIDTDAVTTQFYLSFLEMSEIEPERALAESLHALNYYDLILYMEPDVPFVQDGDRSEVMAANRTAYSESFKALLSESHPYFYSLSGDYQARYQKAMALVNEILK